MEDIKAYIESGILELYVLGDVSHEEKLEVEAMAAKHPAIKAELEEIEKSLELYAKANEVDPAENLRDRILNSLVVNLGDDRNFASKEKAPEPKVIPFEKPKTTNIYKYAFAACLALLIASVIALISVYNRLQVSNNLVASLQSQNQKFANTVSFKDDEIGVLRDRSYKVIRMGGTPKSPDAGLSVAWSPVKKKVWIDMADAKMPANDQAHQYQLWAIVGKTPVSLGVFDADTTSKDMKQMQSIASADAFAVTLEKRGGSPTPTMDAMVVIGKF
ncbi:anti-sigma factor [Mucilaginibacter ginsenosidivorans]|uniref:Regulator of SigK n=1 Tax=Mucilaginibacter ginsenosidivorans TaxID=398053 RepID=A0A5B8UTK2_9SPHI|nr:anti-sigma factor [Mucilaginibacter ginsenosidivorans]QEC62273.1 anti-sigma factor [Mucilaginibacter ginsenosidivorans]